MPISRNLNSYTLNVQEFKSAVPRFLRPFCHSFNDKKARKKM